MEEEIISPSQINSIDDNKVLQSSIVYLNKKRKFQEEQSGLPLPKHQCWDRSFGSECGSPSNEFPRVQDLQVQIIRGKTVYEETDDESEMESAKDSNSFGWDTDSGSSVSAHAKMQFDYLKTYPSDIPSTSSVDWGNGSFRDNLYSLDSRSVAKSDVGRDKEFPSNDFGLHSCLKFDKHLLEYGGHDDYIWVEHGNDSIEQCPDKEIDDMLCSNGSASNGYVLSSGRWSVNQGHACQIWRTELGEFSVSPLILCLVAHKEQGLAMWWNCLFHICGIRQSTSISALSIT